MTIEEFADVSGARIEIYHEPGARSAWIASIKRGETKYKDNFLKGIVGWGNTPTAALNDMIRNIKGEVLVLNAYGVDRKEIQIPRTLTEYAEK